MDLIAAPLVSAIIGAVVGAVVSGIGSIGRRARERDEREIALANGVRSLLRSDIVKTHHRAVSRGYAPTIDKEIMQRDYDAYHGLGGNGVATTLYEETMALPTRED